MCLGCEDSREEDRDDKEASFYSQRAPRNKHPGGRAGTCRRGYADRLANPDKEPQNWLMNHGSYDAQRFSPLARINKDNVKNLKLAYAVALGGSSVGENLQATPLVEDGFMYV